jgi:hypothetical protein
MDEREFFSESEESKPAPLNCPHCRQVETYELRWIVRRKKNAPPPRASEEDRRKFAAVKSYMVRKDDLVVCKNPRCRKRIEVSGVQSVAFLVGDSTAVPGGAPQLPVEPGPPPKPQVPKFRPKLFRQH